MKHFPFPARCAALLLAALLAAGCGGNDAVNDRATSGGDELVYSRAKDYMDAGNYERAIFVLERLEVLFPFSDYTRRGQLDLIYAYYRDGQVESAIDTANKFIRENPTHPDVDYAYYLRGLVYFDRDRGFFERLFRVNLAERPPSDADKSLSNFAELVRRFPESEYAPDARQRMVYLRNRLAAYDLHVAEYYLSMRAWIAAVNRAKNIVENYQDSDWVPDALRVLVRGYTELGMEDLAADAQRVLEQNDDGAGSRKRRGLFRRAGSEGGGQG